MEKKRKGLVHRLPSIPPLPSDNIESALGMPKGSVQQMKFLDFQEIALTDYESEAFDEANKHVENAQQTIQAAQAVLQKAQTDIQQANIAAQSAKITQTAILDLVRRRAGFPNKQNWYDPKKSVLIVDPN